MKIEIEDVENPEHKQNAVTEEIMDLVSKHPNAKDSTFFIDRDKDYNPIVRELNSKKKLSLMDKIAGKNIILQTGESRDKKNIG